MNDCILEMKKSNNNGSGLPSTFNCLPTGESKVAILIEPSMFGLSEITATPLKTDNW
jgi:hypothetical protein